MKVTITDHAGTREAQLVLSPANKPTRTATPVSLTVNGERQEGYARSGGSRPHDPEYDDAKLSESRYSAETWFRHGGKWHSIIGYDARNALSVRLQVTP